MAEARVFVVDGARTPFLKAKGAPGDFSAADLAVAAARPLLARMPFAPTLFDEVIVGCVIAAPDEADIARIIALRLGCGKAVPAYTGIYSVHGPAIDVAGKGIALIAPSKTGKTTHSWGLLRHPEQGWSRMTGSSFAYRRRGTSPSPRRRTAMSRGISVASGRSSSLWSTKPPSTPMRGR